MRNHGWFTDMAGQSVHSGTLPHYRAIKVRMATRVPWVKEDVFLINHLFDSTSMERCFCLPDAMWRVQLYVVVPGFSPQAKETK